MTSRECLRKCKRKRKEKVLKDRVGGAGEKVPRPGRPHRIVEENADRARIPELKDDPVPILGKENVKIGVEKIPKSEASGAGGTRAILLQTSGTAEENHVTILAMIGESAKHREIAKNRTTAGGESANTKPSGITRTRGISNNLEKLQRK